MNVSPNLKTDDLDLYLLQTPWLTHIGVLGQWVSESTHFRGWLGTLVDTLQSLILILVWNIWILSKANRLWTDRVKCHTRLMGQNIDVWCVAIQNQCPALPGVLGQPSTRGERADVRVCENGSLYKCRCTGAAGSRGSYNLPQEHTFLDGGFNTSKFPSCVFIVVLIHRTNTTWKKRRRVID